jgi:hypothetical protein
MKANLIIVGAALILAACAPSTPEASTTPAVNATPTAAAPSLSAEPQPLAPPRTCAYSSTDVPDQAMVLDLFHNGTGVTENCVDHRPEEAYFEYLPDPCARGLGIRSSSIVARRAIEVLFDEDPSTADPETATYRHTVTVYNSTDAASAYMSSVRAAVRDCPVRKLRHATWTYKIASSTAQRLELSVRRVYELAEGVPPVATFRLSIARSGARVSVLVDVGWEGIPSYDVTVTALFKAAADQLERWS